MKLMASGRDLFGGHGEVAFVFAVLVVDEDDHAALADLFDGFFDGSELGVVFSHKWFVLSFFRMIALVLAGMGVAPDEAGARWRMREEWSWKMRASKSPNLAFVVSACGATAVGAGSNHYNICGCCSSTGVDG